MMTTAIPDVHAAYVAALMGDSTLAALITGVYEDPPQDGHFPYIIIESVEMVRDTFGRQGRALTVTLHVWSGYDGYKEAATIIGHCARILNRQTFALASGATMAYNLLLGSPVMISDPDSNMDSRQITQRFDTYIEE